MFGGRGDDKMTTTQEVALWIIAISLALNTAIALRNMFSSKAAFKGFEEIRGRRPKNEAITTPMSEGRYPDALALALEMQKSKPGDPYVWYYAGVCYYRLKEMDKALVQFRQAELLSPSWVEKTTGPYIRLIEEQIKTREQKAG